MGGNFPDIVAHAHDDDARLAAAVHDKALVLLGRPFQNLAELRAVRAETTFCVRLFLAMAEIAIVCVN